MFILMLCCRFGLILLLKDFIISFSFNLFIYCRAKYKAELERMLSAPGNVEQIAAEDHRVFEEILTENETENRRVAEARQNFHFLVYCTTNPNFLTVQFLNGKIFAEKNEKKYVGIKSNKKPLKKCKNFFNMTNQNWNEKLMQLNR